MVSVLAIRTNVRGFKPGRGDGYLRAIRDRKKPSFGGEVKPEAPHRTIKRHVKNHLQVQTKIIRKAKFIFPYVHYSCLLRDDSDGRISRKLWWKYQEFTSDDIIP
jgi:hypothetical protein